MKLFDTLVNLMSGMGTSRDKTTGSEYVLDPLDDLQLTDAYRSGWLPRKIIDIPAKDATAKWRKWHAEADTVGAIEAEEKRLGVQALVQRALILARLKGGGAIYFSVKGQSANLAEPLRLERVGRGGLEYAVAISREQLAPTELISDPRNPGYGTPVAYTFANAPGTVVHPSRIVRLVGAPLPDPFEAAAARGSAYGWGDSILQTVLAACRRVDSASGNIESMLFEAKQDVFKIPDFMAQVAVPSYREKIMQRLSLSAVSKGVNGVVLMDKEEDYETKQLQFGGIPDVFDRLMQAAAGAADIPLTRLIGVTAKGLGNGGDMDLRHYYDTIRELQSLTLGPALTIFDECLYRSATGKGRPDTDYYEWANLWAPTSKEQADIGKIVAETIKTISESGVIDDTDALAQAAVNMLTENNVMPGLESYMNPANRRTNEDDDL